MLSSPHCNKNVIYLAVSILYYIGLVLVIAYIFLLDTVNFQMQMNVPATPVEMAAHAKTRTTSTVVNVQQVSTVSTVKQV